MTASAVIRTPGSIEVAAAPLLRVVPAEISAPGAILRASPAVPRPSADVSAGRLTEAGAAPLIVVLPAAPPPKVPPPKAPPPRAPALDVVTSPEPGAVAVSKVPVDPEPMTKTSLRSRAISRASP